MLDTVTGRPASETLRPNFDYDAAFSRTLGWTSQAEQQRLRLARVAIAGVGGVGGAHAVTFARLGIGAFHIADFDRFELVNFNRQFGAGVSTLGRAKVDVIAEAIRDINPHADVATWPEGVREESVGDFLDGVDLFIDGIDFFALGIRRTLFAEARARGIPAITAAPLGTGVAWLSFVPGGLSFEDYFAFAPGEDPENYVRFLVGLAPSALHMGALVDRRYVDFSAQRGPSTPMACMQCAGVAVTEGMKLLLGRDGVRAAPWHHQFDPYSGRKISRRSWWGGDNPVRRLKLAVASRLIRRASAAGLPGEIDRSQLSEQVIALAKWAPSGDNEQNWHFLVHDERRFTVSFPRHDAANPYHYAGGRPHWLAAGALLESIALAATRHGAVAAFEERPADDGGIAFDVRLDPGAGRADPLSLFLETRSVDRSRFRRTPLTETQRTDLARQLGPRLAVEFRDSQGDRLAAARLNAQSTVLRMVLPQAWPVHARVFRFDSDRPETGIPMRSVPLDPLSRRLLRWSLSSLGRARLLSRTLFGARFASLQTDIVPGLSCAAVFVLRIVDDRRDARAMVEAGRGLMRFWLEAERLGLVLQPAVATLALAQAGADPALEAALRRRSGRLNRDATAFYGDLDDVVFAGRIGRPRKPLRTVRSLRREN
jgi:molybdopterin/thiamine biosynthesis adenylyltransferase